MFGFSLKPVNSFSSFFLLSLANSETKRRDILGFVKTGDPGPLSQISWSSKGQLYEGQLPGGGGGGGPERSWPIRGCSARKGYLFRVSDIQKGRDQEPINIVGISLVEVYEGVSGVEMLSFGSVNRPKRAYRYI